MALAVSFSAAEDTVIHVNNDFGTPTTPTPTSNTFYPLTSDLDSVEFALRVADVGVVDSSQLENALKNNNIFWVEAEDDGKYIKISDPIKSTLVGISYNSSEAVEEAEKVMSLIDRVSKEESRALAKERGAFPNFSKSIYKEGEPIRNATTTTIAPTGSISVLISTSSGIEPIFSPVQLRNVSDSIGENLVEVDREFRRYLEKKGMYDEKSLETLIKTQTAIGDLVLPRDIKEEIINLFTTAHDIPWEQHLKIQATFQKHVDNAVSKTINLPNSATLEDIAQIYLRAHEIDCKGLTIYRAGSRDNELLKTQLLVKPGDKLDYEGDTEEKRGRDIPGLIGLQGVTYQIRTGCGPLFVTINHDGEQILEIFSNMNPSGGCGDAQTTGSGILCSLGLHEASDPQRLIRKVSRHLREISCPKKNNLVGYVSCSAAIVSAVDLFEKHLPLIKQGNIHPFFTDEKIPLKVREQNLRHTENSYHNPDKVGLCPSCNVKLIKGIGCERGECPVCRWSNCG